jgi:hypothetical protein
MRIITYESVLAGHDVPRQGTYIFSNINRLRRFEQAARLKNRELCNQLIECNGPDKVLNDPARSLSRFELLRTLYERGINEFNAYRIGGSETPKRFPVFIRKEGGPEYQTPRLLHNAAEYEATVRGITWLKRSESEGMIAVELCDTSDAQGVYSKYAAFVIGDKVVPRHLIFSRNWMVKLADLTEPAMIEAELAYMRQNPHADMLRECARLANTTYGRIDYAMKNGRPQFWEINTNSMLTMPMGVALSVRDEVQRQFASMIIEAFAALDSG